MKIKKIGILMIAGTLMCTSPAATVMASDATETVQEIITDNEIDSLVTLTEEEENKLINIVKEIKNADINEEQLRSTVNKVYDKLEEMGIGKKEVKGILQKLIELAKNILE